MVGGVSVVVVIRGDVRSVVGVGGGACVVVVDVGVGVGVGVGDVGDVVRGRVCVDVAVADGVVGLNKIK